MRIGFAQFAPVFGDVDATIRELDRLGEQFESADLVVLPELCNSGYDFASPAQALSLATTKNDGIH